MRVETIIPTIPPRADMLLHAIESVIDQVGVTGHPLVMPDPNHTGTAATVARGVAKSTGEWIALLGDDDWLMPRHHERLLLSQAETGADVTYGWYFPIGAPDFQPNMFGRPFNEELFARGSFIPGGGSLIRGDLLREVGIPQITDPEHADTPYDDYAMYRRLHAAGAKFHHLAERLYCWRFWAPGNTGGDPTRW